MLVDFTKFGEYAQKAIQFILIKLLEATIFATLISVVTRIITGSWPWRESKNTKKIRKLEQKNKKLLIWEKQLQQRDKDLNEKRNEIEILTRQTIKNEELLTQKLASNLEKEVAIEEKLQRIKIIKKEAMEHLEGKLPLDNEKIKSILFSLVQEDMEAELNEYKEATIKQTKDEVKKISTEIICTALEKYSTNLVVEKTTDTLTVDKKEIIGKLIGKGGRNIGNFQKITGTNLIIEQEQEGVWTVQISCFNSLRREIAYQTLLKLVEKEKISPIRLETVYEEIKQNIDEIIERTGRDVLQELGIVGVHPDMVTTLGRLKFRTSYGQNVLLHSIEVAKLVGNMALELGLDVSLARRVGLFHDIGKAINEEQFNHVKSGIYLAERCNEPKEVINAILSHHDSDKANNPYSALVLAADKLSAARIGARGQQTEAYLARMETLEKIGNNFIGVKQTFAFQGGREIWVILEAGKTTDRQAWEISIKLKKKIKKIGIPGDVNLYVLRETKVVQKINE